MKLDDVKKLHQKKYRTQFGYYLVEGEHLVLELDKAIKSGVIPRRQADKITLFVSGEQAEWAKTLHRHYNLVEINKKQMAHISDTKTPQGIVASVPLPKGERPGDRNARYIYLHEIQDPGNLGTILRSLAWFGDFNLMISPNSVDPFNPKVVRSSMGAIFHVPLEQDVELTDLQARFKTFAYLDMQGDPINSPAFSRFECYLFGNEARGVPGDALAACNAQPFTINGCGKIDSLNLASAVNICTYQLSQHAG